MFLSEGLCLGVVVDNINIIIMATKSVKKIQVQVLRSSRRLKNRSQLPCRAMQAVESEGECGQSDFNNQMCMPNDEQLKLKPEKQSTSPPNHEGFTLNTKNERLRRVTRSFSHIATKLNAGIDNNIEQITPEQNTINKIQEQDTSKKNTKSNLVQDCFEVQLSDTHLTNKKNSHRPSELFSSPYTEFRKSYRKLHKREIISIPYRKCHDALQGRIVSILNKLEAGKNCLRDFDGLIEKMNKITSKDLRNRFIVSGIKTIIAVSEEKNIYDPKIIEKLRIQQQKLQQRLVTELEAIDEYQYVQTPHTESLNAEGCFQLKSLIVRKLYQNIRRRYPQKKRELREKLFIQCQKLFEGEFSMKLMIKFIRSKLEAIR